MATPEEVEEINDYLQAHAQRQARKEEERKGLLYGLQHALFGETHADYPAPTPSAAASLPAVKSTNSSSAPVPATARERTSMASLAADAAPQNFIPPAATRTTPAIMPSSTNMANKVDIALPVVQAPKPQDSIATQAPNIIPAVRTPPSEKKYAVDPNSYKTPDDAGVPTFNPPPARFNPYPNPYRKSIPSPEKFSDNTAPPWVMRTLPSESRDDDFTRPSAATSGGVRGMDEKVAPTRMAATAPSATTIAARPTPNSDPKRAAATSQNNATPNNSTRTKVMALIQETEKKDGNDSSHHMPWHEPASKEISPNELVGIAPTPRPNRAPVVSSSSIASPKEIVSSASVGSGTSKADGNHAQPHELSEQERAYLLRKEQEYDSQYVRGVTATPSGNNSAIDDKKAILSRLKELMAQQGRPTTQN